jgi:glycosyltransferase involved in cell wall biosynthesis
MTTVTSSLPLIARRLGCPPVRLLLLGPLNSPHVEHLALAMRERGHEVAAAGEPGDGLPASGLPAAGIPITEIRGRDLVGVRRAFRRTRPDVVHAHWLPGAAFMAALVRARPLIAMAWGSDVYAADRRRLLQSRYTLRRCDVAMADSRALLDRLIELGAAPERAQLMRWGVDLDLFSPPNDRAAAKRELGLPDAPVILSARGLAPVYNPDVVLSAFERLRERVPDAVLVLKHLGPGEPALAGGPVPPGVRIVGNVPYEQLPAYFRAADVCMSIPQSDSSPRSVWEAMACGCPCVLSDLPWTRELIENDRHALLVSTEPEATAATLERVLTDQSLAERLRIEGRALVERHHDRKVEMDRLSELYATVAAGRQL